MLTGRQVSLGPLLEGDSEQLFAWINDRDLVINNAPYRPVGLESHRAWMARAQGDSPAYLFAIRLLEDGRLVGTCQLNSVEPLHRTAQLAIRIGQMTDRNRGLGTDAVETLLAFGFRDANLQRIWLHVFAHNVMARRTYAKAGMQEEGVLRQAAFIDGAYRDVVVMAALRPDA